MNRLNGGYIMVDLAKPTKALEALSATYGTKPILVYDASGVPSFAKSFKKVGTSVALRTENATVVIKADGTVIKSDAVEDITKVPTELLEALEAGDIVVKKTTNQYHSYRVSYKEVEQGIILTYVDATSVESVSYDWSTNKFVYNSTDHTTLTPDA